MHSIIAIEFKGRIQRLQEEKNLNNCDIEYRSKRNLIIDAEIRAYNIYLGMNDAEVAIIENQVR